MIFIGQFCGVVLNDQMKHLLRESVLLFDIRLGHRKVNCAVSFVNFIIGVLVYVETNFRLEKSPSK